MRLFRCSCPSAPALHFENVSCGRCRRLVGFSPESRRLRPFEPAGQLWRDDDGRLHRLCANRSRHAVCNWMMADHSDTPFCLACRLNRVIPDLSVPGNLDLWRELEQAKRRCLYTFLELGLPFVESREPGDLLPDGRHVAPVPAPGDGAPAAPVLGFRFMADPGRSSRYDGSAAPAEPVITGHEDGIVTINLAEADAIARTRTQLAMRERYRTLLGHFRHETGHLFWDWFMRLDDGFAERFRTRFGDERSDYTAAVDRHYQMGAPADWQRSFISAYASMHPWEDWAETWAHYLHMVDTLETQQSFGAYTGLDASSIRDLQLPFVRRADRLASAAPFDELVALWVKLTVLLNGLNRSMGLPDPYPFVLNPSAIAKLGFVHETIVGACTHR